MNSRLNSVCDIRVVRTAPTFDRSVKHRPTARTVITAPEDVAESGDPRSSGQALTGNRPGYWRYKVGHFRIICFIDDREMVIVALDDGHRPRAYRR